MANSRYVRPWLPYNIFCGKYDPIQLHRKIICTSKCSDFQKKVIDTITTSNFYLKSKENNENNISFCYFSCLRRYFCRPMSMAALSLSALTRCIRWSFRKYFTILWCTTLPSNGTAAWLMDKTETIQGKSGHENFNLYQALES